MGDCYDKDGSPMSLLEWSEKFRDKAYQRVARDTFTLGSKTLLISTVWLGLDHNLLGSKPHIFETMVFEGDIDKDGEAIDELTRRYSTLKQALAGHRKVMAQIPQFLKEHN